MQGIHCKRLSVLGKNFKTLMDSLEYEFSELKYKCVQIFTHGPNNTKKNKIDYEKVKNFCQENKIQIWVHSTYMSIGFFSKDNEKGKFYEKHIKEQLDSCKELGALGLVLHITSIEIEKIVKLVKKIDDYNGVKIIIEPTSASIYNNYDNLYSLGLALKNVDCQNWGFCLDTCHLWAYGIDITKKPIPEKVYEFIGLIHCNGASKKIFNTKKDFHLIPNESEDNLWKNKTDLKQFLTLCKTNKWSVIYEVKRGNATDIRNIF